MAMTDGAYRTTDMTFATVLIMNGHNPVMERIEAGKVAWAISSEDYDESVDDLLEEFQRGACLVEPVRFMREVRLVRQRMYTLLGVGDKPRGSRTRHAPSV